MRVAEDKDSNQYLFWKVEATEARVPEFDEVAAEVTLELKRIEARVAAKERAMALAKQLQGGVAMKDAVGPELADKVLTTKEFSWLVADPLGGRLPEIPEIEGIDRPGHGFMRAVAALAPGEAGYAFNEPESVVYVIRVVKDATAPGMLRDRFFIASYFRYQLNGRLDVGEVVRAWQKSLFDEEGVNWERPPLVE
jgi:hypothetical protein